jgi:hypothetical protein
MILFSGYGQIKLGPSMNIPFTIPGLHQVTPSLTTSSIPSSFGPTEVSSAIYRQLVSSTMDAANSQDPWLSTSMYVNDFISAVGNLRLILDNIL